MSLLSSAFSARCLGKDSAPLLLLATISALSLSLVVERGAEGLPLPFDLLFWPSTEGLVFCFFTGRLLFDLAVALYIALFLS